MAKGDEIIEEEPTKKKKEKTKKEKPAKKQKGGPSESPEGAAIYTDAEEEEEGGGFSIALITILIIIIWLAILCLLIKLDVGGFGSNFLYPIFKDTPVINKILPEAEPFSLPGDSGKSELEEEFPSLASALSEIESLRKENERLKNANTVNATDEQIAAMREEIERLKTFEESQVEFQRVKTEFYEEVVFSDEAPSIEEYRKYYEEIDPENAEYLYKQVITQIEADKELDEYVKAYSSMKPKSAAAVFEEMTDNLELVAKILGRMDSESRAKILNVIDAEVASRLTKIMDPD
ncbi:MAG: hypothetical protein K5886_05110 [Lachnospiraceae bacterium]|nr:hypothetical protein [Lachnospiraceae bacterium]